MYTEHTNESNNDDDNDFLHCLPEFGGFHTLFFSEFCEQVFLIVRAVHSNTLHFLNFRNALRRSVHLGQTLSGLIICGKPFVQEQSISWHLKKILVKL